LNGGFLARGRFTQRIQKYPPWSWHLGHAIAHLLSWQLGRVVTATDEVGDVWVGFRCEACARLDAVEPGHAVWHRRPKDGDFT
jgi:hypothetical protein